MEHELPIGLRFSILSRTFRQELDRQLKEKGLTGVQLGVLAELMRLECEGRSQISQRELELVNRVTHPTMTDIIKRLEAKGFIRCDKKPSDRRHKCISSTEKARQLHEEMGSIGKAVYEQLCRGLSRQQREQFILITDVMLENAAEMKGAKNCCDKNPAEEPAGI